MPITEQLEPLRLIEDAETGDRFVLYSKQNGQALELRFEGDEPWVTEKQIAQLFGVTQQNANYHINNIYKDGELPDAEATYKEFLYVAGNGQTYRPTFNYPQVIGFTRVAGEQNS